MAGDLWTGPDERLLDALRALSRRLDPVPPPVADAARAAFVWRAVDHELAALSYDSLLADPVLAGVRGAASRRHLSFETTRLAVDIEVEAVRGRRRVIGQIAPPQVARVELCGREGPMPVAVDALGRFVAADLPGGPVSLRCWPAGAGDAIVATEWVAL